MFNFDIIKKGKGLVSAPHFVYHFSGKILLVLLLTNQISMSYCLYQFLLEIMVNMYILIICFPVYEIMNFEIDLSILI